MTFVVQQVRDKFFKNGKDEFAYEADKLAWVRLRVEKPMAVPMADAPVIEVVRPVATD